MNPYISKTLDTYREPRHLLGAKGLRVTHRLTHEQTTANPGETLYVRVPVLPEGVALVPESLAIIAKITLTGKKDVNNRVVQNLGKAIISRRIIKVGENILEDLARPDLIELYADIWRPTQDRDNLVGQGICSVEVNRHRSGSGNKNSVASDIALASAFSKYRIPLSDCIGVLTMFKSHGALTTSEMPQIRLELVLAPPEDVIVGSDPTKLAYQLFEIELEYITLQLEQTHLPAPPRILYNHIVHHSTIPFDRATQTLIADTVHVQRSSFVGLLFLFVVPHTAGARDTESFVDPGVKKVEFDIDSIPNTLFPRGMLPPDVWGAAQTGAEWLIGGTAHRPGGFFVDKYALFIDLRAARDHTVHGDGRRAIGAGKNLQFRIHRAGTGTGNCNLHLFILSEAAFESNRLYH